MPPDKTPLAEVTFVAFDTETTGLDAKNDSIVEIGAVKYRGGKIIEEATWLVDPRRWIPFWVQQIHGITPEMVKGKPTFAEAYPEFEAFIGDAVLIAHNAPFDIGFVREELKRCKGRAPPNVVIDSLPLFRKWFPESESHTLADLARHTKVKGDTFHRATSDAAYIIFIMEKGLKRPGRKPSFGALVRDAGGLHRFK